MSGESRTLEETLGEKLRKQGYTISSGERSPGASAVAAPIRDRSGRLIAVVSILGPSQRLTRSILKELGKQGMRVAQEISAAFGYRPDMF
jgi:DNA-binding IclR family transcriptional regulator